MYKVVTINNNGYRCCCSCHFDNQEFYSSLEEALERVPTQHPQGNDFGELEEIYVYDMVKLDSGKIEEKEIASGQLVWLSSRYSVQRWFGHKNGVPFEEIKGLTPEEIKLNETWEQIQSRFKREKLELEIKKKEKELEELRQSYLS